MDTGAGVFFELKVFFDLEEDDFVVFMIVGRVVGGGCCLYIFEAGGD